MIYKHSKLHNLAYPACRDTHSLIAWAKLVNEIITDRFDDKQVNLIGTGSSGAILCTAITTITRPNSTIVLIRKEKEDTHRDLLSITRGRIVLDSEVNIILDDHIASGRTLQYILGILNDHFLLSKIDLLISKEVDTYLEDIEGYFRVVEVISGSVTSNEYQTYAPTFKQKSTQLYEPVKPTESLTTVEEMDEIPF